MEIKDAAVEKLKEILKEEKAGSCLRVFLTGGCCGPSIAIGIAPKPDKDDIELAKKDFRIYMHKDAAPQLQNATMDCDKNGEIVIKGISKHDGGCCH